MKTFLPYFFQMPISQPPDELRIKFFFLESWFQDLSYEQFENLNMSLEQFHKWWQSAARGSRDRVLLCLHLFLRHLYIFDLLNSNCSEICGHLWIQFNWAYMQIHSRTFLEIDFKKIIFVRGPVFRMSFWLLTSFLDCSDEK